MKRKPTYRYYCEWCLKSSCSAGHIKRHEESCTANPERVCQMHKHCDEPQRPIHQLIRAILNADIIHSDFENDHYDLAPLREAASGCPACMLSAIRISGLAKNDYTTDFRPIHPSFNFDFKAELTSFWNTVNDAEHENAYR